MRFFLFATLFVSVSSFTPAPRPFGVSLAIMAEPTDTDWESEIMKLEKEGEDRLDAKAAELMRNIESSGLTPESKAKVDTQIAEIKAAAAVEE
mmetsp:Transcript_22932/g.26142  ORF Transcript_22932/g.26142 Transcript_22932/m.26142 type:complete len:93 (-) Transcript_22932:266-544(-)